MIYPIDVETLFETHDNYEVISFENDILIIDNWYPRYNEIYDILTNTFVPKWKGISSGKNFIDYYDCRLIIPVHFLTEKTQKNLQNLSLIILKYFGGNEVHLTHPPYQFNYYKAIKKNISNNFQHHPHIDLDINCIVYMDNICSGGTAIYDKLEHCENKEEINLLHDISSYEKTIIQSKPNRLVVFRGLKYHGGFIENHNDYVSNWRINQVTFFKTV